jgi:translocation and assembly module TamB
MEGSARDAPGKPAGSRTRLVLRWVWRVVKGLAAATLALVLAVVLVLYLDLSVTRRFVVRVANGALAPVFQGRLTILHLGRLRFDGIDGTRVRLVDPAGHAVFVVEGLHARIATMKLVRGLFASPRRIELDIPVARIDHVDFVLDTDDAGTPLVAAAFTPKPAAETSGPSSPGPIVSLVISQALIAHAWVHGTPTWAPPLDTELTDVDGRVVVTPEGAVEVSVRHASLAARALPVGGDGTATVKGNVRVPSEHGNAVGIDATFRGTFAGVDHSGRFTLDGDLVSADLDVDEVTPSKVRPFVPGYPLEDVVSAHVGARGTFPLLDVDARARFRAGGTLIASGQATLSTKKTLSLHASLAAIDLRGFGTGLPASALSASVDGTIALDADSNLTGTVNVALKGSTLASFVLPDAEVRGTFARSARSGFQAEATLTLHDPGLDGQAHLRLDPNGASYDLVFDVRAEAPQLGAIPRFSLPLSGVARASASGTLSFDKLVVTADATGAATNLVLRGDSASIAGRRPVLSAKTVTCSAHASGSLFLPVVRASAHLDTFELASFRSETADVTATGTVTSPHVHVSLQGGDAPDVDADADVNLGRTTILNQLRAVVSRGKDSLEVKADTIHVSAESASVEQLTLHEQAGEAQGRLRMAPHVLEVLGEGHGIDLAALSRIFGLEARCQKGDLAFSVDAAIHGRTAVGRATVDVTNASVFGIEGAGGHADLTLDADHLTGRVHAELGDIGAADLVATNVHLDKQDLAALHTWERMWGTIELRANVDLARLDAALPKGVLPFGSMSGRLEFAGKTRRLSATDGAPQLAFTMTTSKLVVQGKALEATSHPLAATAGSSVDGKATSPGRKKDDARDLATWRIEGVDVGVDGRIEAETGYAEIAARLFDSKGPLVAFDIKSAAVPYSALMAQASSVRELLSTVPFDAHVEFPKRELSTLPPALDLHGAEGLLEATLDARGTWQDPLVDLSATLNHMTETTRFGVPVDLELSSHYKAGAADVELSAQSAKGGKLLQATGRLEARLADLVTSGLAAPWHAGLRAHVDRFPLGAIGALEDRQIRGDLSGDVELKDLHREGSASVDLVIPELLIGEVRYKDARLRGTLDGHAVEMTADLREVAGNGAANAHIHAGTAWGDSLFPHLTDSGPVDVAVTAKALRAETLLPFAHETLAELEGQITGSCHFTFDPKVGKPKLEGRLTFDHGKFELESALGEFHDAQATLVLSPDGLIMLENATASGVTGKVEAAATARILLDASNGLSLGAARAKVRIPTKQAIPVTVEGTPVGTVEGTLTLSEDPLPGGKGMKVSIEIPTLHVQLPQSGNRSAQGLGDIEDARIEARHGTEVVTIPLGPELGSHVRGPDAKRIELTVHLGDDVELKRGTDLKVGLTGQAAVTVTDTARVTGQLQLKKGGTLDVEGKTFEIESGSVSFVGDDPSNPQVVVTAGWTAPEGTRVYADYIGPLKTGKVTLRSQPPYSRSDIVALLLFGSTEGSSGAAQGQAATNTATNQAAGIAGNVAAQPINHALDQFGIHAVSARVDTSQAANPKPEVELQVAKDISIQIAQVLGTPAPGSNPDTTLLTLNWRFLKALSLSTTVGNYGSTIVDMVWQRRY